MTSQTLGLQKPRHIPEEERAINGDAELDVGDVAGAFLEALPAGYAVTVLNGCRSETGIVAAAWEGCPEVVER